MLNKVVDITSTQRGRSLVSMLLTLPTTRVAVDFTPFWLFDEAKAQAPYTHRRIVTPNKSKGTVTITT